MKNMGNIMKQAQKMQEELKRVQEEIARTEVTGEAGGGMVKVTMTGNHTVKRVAIDPAVAQDDVQMLEDLVAAAINDACRRVETMTKEQFSGMTAGMNLPPGMNLPF